MSDNAKVVVRLRTDRLGHRPGEDGWAWAFVPAGSRGHVTGCTSSPRGQHYTVAVEDGGTLWSVDRVCPEDLEVAS